MNYFKIVTCARCPTQGYFHMMFDTALVSSVKNPRICKSCWIEAKDASKVKTAQRYAITKAAKNLAGCVA